MNEKGKETPNNNPKNDSGAPKDLGRREALKYLGALAGLFGAKLVGCGRPVGDAGPEGCDAGPEGCDAGPEGCDAGPEGCDAGQNYFGG